MFYFELHYSKSAKCWGNSSDIYVHNDLKYLCVIAVNWNCCWNFGKVAKHRGSHNNLKRLMWTDFTGATSHSRYFTKTPLILSLYQKVKFAVYF